MLMSNLTSVVPPQLSLDWLQLRNVGTPVIIVTIIIIRNEQILEIVKFVNLSMSHELPWRFLQRMLIVPRHDE